MVRRFRPSYSRWLALLNGALCCTAWYGGLAWWGLASLLVKKPFAEQSIDKPLSTQLADLMYLVFWVGATPKSYYLLRLYNWPRSSWLEFVYPQEARYWQSAQNMVSQAESLFKLRNKQVFANYCLENGVEVVAFIDHIKRGIILSEKRVFSYGDCFIKPTDANALRGCMRLVLSEQACRLSGWSLTKRWIQDYQKNSIVERIQTVVDKHDIVIQPLLKNHSALDVLADSYQDIITVRVISCVADGGRADVVFAALEVPNKEDSGWDTYDIDLTQGRLLSLDPLLISLIQEKENIIQPFWPKIETMTQHAHSYFSDVKTIAWDLAITEHGPLIIEGNWGWSPLLPQRIMGKPLLQGALLRCYLSELV